MCPEHRFAHSCARPERTAQSPHKLSQSVVVLLFVALPAAGCGPGRPPDVEGAAACPGWTVLAGGKCTLPIAEPPHSCKPGDRADCEAQCERGHAPSCA